MDTLNTRTTFVRSGLALCCVLLGRTAPAQDVSFIAPRTFASGTNPMSVAVADFNSDGVLDLVVANFGSNSVSVLLGNGDGSFQPARSFAVGNEPISVAVGDFNGDGRLDLAVANNFLFSSSISVLLGNGDGTFQTALSFPAGGSPRFIAVADFNGDGVLDLAVANWVSATVSILLGNGDGTFQAPQNFFAETEPNSIAVGDYDGDGRLDLAVANYSSVVVLLGNGDGSFQPARLFSAGAFPVYSVAVGDFNGD